MFRFTASGLLLLLSLAGCAAPEVIELRPGASPPVSLDAPEFEYHVGGGDVLRVNVFGHPDLSSPTEGSGIGTPIVGNGSIVLPLIGALDVDGMSVLQVASAVRERLLRYLRDPRVDVTVLEYGAHRALIFGEVARPGSVVLSRPTTALEILAQAGGFTAFANRSQIAWVRGGVQQANLQVFDAANIDPTSVQWVEAGDLLFVGRRYWTDAAEAVRDILPLLTALSIPLSIAVQAATLERIN